MGHSQSATKARDSTHLDEVYEVAAAVTTGIMEQDLSTRVELNVVCFNLRKKYSTRCVVYLKRSQDPQWTEIGKTEIVADSSDPCFVKSVLVDFCFEVQQKLRFEIYNVTTPSNPDVVAQEFIGGSEAFLAEIVAGTQNRPLQRPLRHHKLGETGTIQIVAEEMSRLKSTCHFTIRAEDLPVMNMFSRKADPYCVLYRSPASKGKVELDAKARDKLPIYRTEVVNKSLNPKFERIELSVQHMCRGEDARPVIIEVWDSSRLRSNFIGSCHVNYGDFHRASTDRRSITKKIVLKKGKRSISRGTLIIENVEVVKKYSFLDYILGGLEIALVVGIDFTRSNGDPVDPESLHYFNDEDPNEYAMAVKSVGEILQHYDTDKRYPVYGFGAKIPPSHTCTSHCFALTGNFFDPEVNEIQGIIDVYKRALGVTYLHGPTNFAELITLVRQFAEQHKDGGDDMRYYILLILTDGVVNDMRETVNAIVKAAETPMSVVIVGVGDEDFRQMDELDADDEPLFSTETNTYQSRDIVQFVPFNEFRGRSYHELAMCTLDEIPREVNNYFLKRNIPPKKVLADGVDNLQKVMAQKDQRDKELAEQREDGFELPDFLRDERDKLISACISQGYAREDVEATVRDGVPSLNPEHLIDCMHFCPRGQGGCFEVHNRKVLNTKPPKKKAQPSRQAVSGAVPRAIANGFQVPGQPDEEQLAVEDARQKLREQAEADGGELHVCKVCFEKPIDTVILECGHQIVCGECSGQIGGLCPLCRQTITRIVRTYGD
mmetsp:Transcript_4449/g.10336  ORF Transcript_4449/g.10336 Transcript_4449/m.10336 type:complete len:774 (-) Transcript_4449:62-2383(-)